MSIKQRPPDAIVAHVCLLAEYFEGFHFIRPEIFSVPVDHGVHAISQGPDGIIAGSNHRTLRFLGPGCSEGRKKLTLDQRSLCVFFSALFHMPEVRGGEVQWDAENKDHS